MKRISALIMALAVAAASISGCSGNTVTSSQPASSSQASGESVPAEAKRGDGKEKYPNATAIELSDDGITVNGEVASVDPEADVYTANDIIFYLAGQGFIYGKGTEADEHEQSEADAHTVLHITQPGEYLISGTLSAGQIAVDLGKEAEDDPEAVVTLILDGIDITCTVAPGVIFYNVYECSDDDEETATYDVDTSAAGANVIIADGSVNNVSGSYVARIYKSYTLSEDGTEVVDNKKLHKYDGAFYSKMSMNMDGGENGTGILHINAENEGLDSELHLTVNGGNIYIVSGDDGINTNEDNVSVTTINGGLVSITVTGEAAGEGDGIDSNGWLVINGGEVYAAACSKSMDSGIDSDMGIYLNGGSVCATGNMLDHISGGDLPYVVFTFSQRQQGGSTYTLKDENGDAVYEWTPENDFTVLVAAGEKLTNGTYTLWQGDTQYTASEGAGGFGGMRPGDFTPPEGFDPENMTLPEGFDPENMSFPEGMTPPEGFDPESMTPPEFGERDKGKAPGENDDATPPERKDGKNNGGRGDRADADTSVNFVISDGGCYFNSVSPVSESAE